ncbi:hypothetical protein AB1Z04_003531 [Vibrio cholerae]|uniref:hypothetical protein n=1 Tax=Vibrio cholerae TaxID=666 RepID=UPI001140E93D|nr:hypothetical protein [Vibrio cholerae]
MELDTATMVSIGSAVVAALALLWAMYTHFSTRKVAKLTYEVSQLSDFGVPESFISDMPHSPVAITVTSRGNKGTDNIILRLKTTAPIENFEVFPTSITVIHNENELSIESARLNPSQEIKLFIRCAGSPVEDQIQDLDLTHSEGAGVNEGTIQSLSFSFMGIEIDYNPVTLTTSIVRLGPFSFR